MNTNSERRDMNDRQRLALKFPCASGPQTTHDRFWRLMRVNGRLLSTILTVDTFNSPPTWHASVAVMPTRKLSAASKQLSISTAKTMLLGVGEDEARIDQTEVAIHYQRNLTDEELSGLRTR